jgi:tetratricopeptide (TPR) repeat protein
MKAYRRLGALALIAACASLVACSSGTPSRTDLDAYIKARDLYLRGSVDQAAAIVSRIESRSRGFHQARLLEGKILYFEGDMKESERAFRQLAESRPGYTEAQLWLLRCLQAQGKSREAGSILDEALALNPGDPRLLQQAGMLRLAADDINGALGFFRRSQEYAVELSQSYIESARVLYRFGMHDKALADLAMALSLLPTESSMRKPVMDLQQRIQEEKK